MYLNIFGCKEDICREYAIDYFEGEVIFAKYEYEDYSGSSDVIFYDNGKIYWESGSHCSCYGLEGQWNPTEYASVQEFKDCIENYWRDDFLEHKDYIIAELEDLISYRESSGTPNKGIEI